MSGYSSPSSPTCGWVLVPEMLSSAMAHEDRERVRPLCSQTLSEGWKWKRKTRIEDGDISSLNEDDGWTNAIVPTEIFKDLFEAGKIDDPHVDRNEDKVTWVGEADWMYRMTFDLDSTPINRKVVLVFEGLDTFAKVYLNDICILKSKVLHPRLY
jgi:beta-mannosidase